MFSGVMFLRPMIIAVTSIATMHAMGITAPNRMPICADGTLLSFGAQEMHLSGYRSSRGTVFTVDICDGGMGLGNG